VVNLLEFSEGQLSAWEQSHVMANVSQGVSFPLMTATGGPLSHLAKIMSQFLSGQPFLSARILAKGLATSPQTIKKILARH
jgi:hypothetical protein